MLKNYFKIAFRNFWRHKLFTLINIIGLSIGISTALVIYLIADFDFSFDKFHSDGDRIYRVVTNFTYSGVPNYNGGVCGALPEAVKHEVTGLETSAPFYELDDFNVIVNDIKNLKRLNKQTNAAFADERYFNLFHYKWLAGSEGSSLNEPFKVVLTSSQAKKYFPAMSYEQMIGQEVIYEDTIKTTVTGVIEAFSENSDISFHDLISYATINSLSSLKMQLSGWGGTVSNMQLFVKILPHVSAPHVENQINGLLKKYYPTKSTNGAFSQSFHLQALGDIHFNSNYGALQGQTADKKTLYGLMIIGAFILFLGCINYINLTTAQSSQRAKEIGIRKTMGSTRGQLVFQYLSETFLLTIFAVIVAMALTPFIVKWWSGFIPKSINTNYLHHPGILVFLLLLTIAVSLLSGFYPSLVLSGYKPILVLKNQAYTGSKNNRNVLLRKSLTVTQFIIAQFFIVATIVVSKQIYYALHLDLGFRKDAIIYIYTPWKDQSQSHKQVLMDEIKSLPQVSMVSIGGDVPSSNGWNSQEVVYRDGKKEIKTNLQTKTGDENYIKVYNIKLLAGRNISTNDTASGVLINNKYALMLGFKKPDQALGKQIDFGKKKEIVGVIGDFHQGSLHLNVEPLAIYPDTKYNNGTIHIALKPKTPNGDEWKQGIEQINNFWKGVYPNEIFEYHFFDDSILKLYESEQRTSKLLKWATALSIFISCLGLLGLSLYTTNQRLKEISIRKILGASVLQIIGLLSFEFTLLILLAFLIVSPLSWWAMNIWMQSFAERTAISWWIFGLTGIIMLLAAVCTSGLQIVQAAITPPAKSLRSE